MPPSDFTSLGEMLLHASRTYEDRVAFTNMGKSFSFKEVQAHADAFASFLQHTLGLEKGDALAVQLPNLLQYPVVLLGALRGGYTLVNVNPLYTARELRHQLKDSQAKALVVLENFADKVEEVLPDTAISPAHVVVARVGDLLPRWKGTLINFLLRYVKKAIPSYHLPQAISFRSALEKGRAKPCRSVSLTPQDVAFLQYTGGTTGLSKGAVLTHHNVLSNIKQIKWWLDSSKVFGDNEVIVTALPIYHIFSLTCNVLGMYALGAANILITNPRDVKGFIKTLRKHRFSFFSGVNTLFNLLMNDPGFSRVDFSNLKVSVAGGMALQSETAKRWKALTGCELLEGYGLSETSPVVCVNLVHAFREGSIGLPVVGTEVALFDEEGKECPMGAVGELCVKGPQVMKAYWNGPEETKAAFLRGYFKTGDMATMDADGFFKIMGRKKEMILVSGFNVYPDEVEDVLVSHPEVLEAGVIGVPDEKTGETVKAFLVSSRPDLTAEAVETYCKLTAEAVDTYCKEQLVGYKRPTQIVFVDALPKSNVGKVLRRLLAEKAS